MCPVFVWTSERSSRFASQYPAVFERFEISNVDSAPDEPGVILTDAETLERDHASIEAFVRAGGAVIAPSPDTDDTNDFDDLLFDTISMPPTEAELLRKLRNATRYVDSQLRLEELNAIGIALSAERNHERLLELILSKAREITNADAGSLFLVAGIDERVEHPDGREERITARWLKFRLAQNDSRKLQFEETILPISSESIAGYVAETGETLNLEDAYAPPPDKPFAINRSFDETTGYRTVSMLVVPMLNQEDQTIGVLQLINKKKARDSTLESPQDFDDGVVSFDDNDERLVRSLASQAAVSVENNDLYRQREHLFERFVLAAVKAIESRDPTTEGHSHRVARMTTELAVVTTRAPKGRYAEFCLGEEQIRELNYAALLHDFGKVGVKEKVLLKATKLFHGELSGVRQRFKTIRRTIEAQHLRRILDRLLQHDATPEEIALMKEELSRKITLVDEAGRTIEAANKPTVTEFSDFDKLEELGRLTYEDIDGRDLPYLNDDELHSLLVSKGTLTGEERKQIESHVEHTYEFLSTIPWTNDLRDIPMLARSHHEKLDGTGYPRQFRAEDIPPQTRMMTIADIYDALTAKDRPYKPAIKTERALTILEEEADSGKIDRALLDLFIEAKVFQHGLTN